MVSLKVALLGAAVPAYALCVTRDETSATCSADTALTRKEYGSLTDAEKLSFIGAVQCVMAKPSVINDVVPATTNKFDDYAAVHVNNTLGIHINGVFLSWYVMYLGKASSSRAMHADNKYKGTVTLFT